jgi:ribosome-associated translation inhibitor RaiA
MQINFNTDNHIEGSAEMSTHFQATVQDILSRFEEDITRVEIHVKDVNAGKDGTPDKYCTLEARLKGSDPVITTAESTEVHHSVKQAAEKMKTVLNKKFEKRQNY